MRWPLFPSLFTINGHRVIRGTKEEECPAFQVEVDFVDEKNPSCPESSTFLNLYQRSTKEEVFAMKKKFSLIERAVLCIGIIGVLVGCASSGSPAGGSMPAAGQKIWKNVSIVGGGFVTGIIYNTKQKGLVYARTDIGGAYRWDTQKEEWIPLTDFAGVEDWGRLGIASLATDPVEPNRLILATGMYTNEWDPTNGEMLISEDYGNTFKRVPLPFKLGANMPGRGIGERLAIDPNNNKIVYFGSFGNGLWRSSDYGYTWEEVTSFPTRGNVYDKDFETYCGGFRHFHGIGWVVFDPASGKPGEGSKHIYVGVMDTGATIYESTDGGVSWHPLAGQPYAEAYKPGEAHGHLSENCPCYKYYPIKCTYSPEGAMIISYNAGFGPFSSSYQGGAIWKYTFATKTWTDISLPKHDHDPNRRTDDRGVGSVAVDWQNPQVLVASTLNEWWPDEVLYRSTDGGKTWNPIWRMTTYPNRENYYELDYRLSPWIDWGTEKALPEQNPKLGWMIVDIEIDPFDSNKLLYVTGATIWGSKNLTDWDKGKKVKIEIMAKGIEETAVLDLISPPEGPHLVSGMGDIGGFVHWDLAKAPNMIVDPYISAVNSLDYAGQKPWFMVRMGDGKMGISDDYGLTWKPAHNYIEGADTGWTGSVAVAADASVILWAPGGKDVPVSWSADRGKTWVPAKGIPSNARLAADRVNPARFYAYHEGVFYASTDGGRNFSAVNSEVFAAGKRDAEGKLPKNEKGEDLMSASDFTAVLGLEGHLWFAAGNLGLFHSVDGGKNWERIPNVEAASVVGLGKAAPRASYQALYINGKIKGKWGIYQSDDKGKNWTRINDDQHQFGVANTAITGDPRIYGRVYLATNGRGIVYTEGASTTTGAETLAWAQAKVAERAKAGGGTVEERPATDNDCNSLAETLGPVKLVIDRDVSIPSEPPLTGATATVVEFDGQKALKVTANSKGEVRFAYVLEKPITLENLVYLSWKIGGFYGGEGNYNCALIYNEGDAKGRLLSFYLGKIDKNKLVAVKNNIRAHEQWTKNFKKTRELYAIQFWTDNPAKVLYITDLSLKPAE